MTTDAAKAAARDKLAALRHGFAPRLRQRIQELADAVDAGSSDVESLAHQLAGTAGSYGFAEAGELAAELELLCQAGFSPDAAQTLIQRLKATLAKPPTLGA